MIITSNCLDLELKPLDDNQVTEIKNLASVKNPFCTDVWSLLLYELHSIYNLKTENYRFYSGMGTKLTETQQQYCKIRLDQLAKEECYFALLALAAEFYACTTKLIDSPFLISGDHRANYHEKALNYMYNAGLHCTDLEAALLRDMLDNKISDAHDEVYYGIYGEEYYYNIREDFKKIYFNSLSRKDCVDDLLDELQEQLDEEYRPGEDYSGWMAVTKLELLRLKGASSEELNKEREKLGTCGALIRMDMENLINSGDTACAAELGCRYIEGNHIRHIYEDGMIAFISDACIKAGMNDKAKKILVNNLKNSGYDQEIYIKAKQLHSESEWLDISEGLKQDWYWSYYDIAAMEVIDGNKEKLKAEMTGERLYSVIKDFRRFESTLYDLAPELLIDSVRTYLTDNIKDVRGTNHYYALANWVAKLLEFPDGESAANELLCEWRQKYPGRKKMFEILDERIN